MKAKTPGYIDVDEISRNLSMEQVAAYFGLDSEELKHSGPEIRTRCFLSCGKECPTGDRVLAIQAQHAAKIWKCHNYECGKQGNLVSLVSLALGGSQRPRGEEFKTVARTMQAILSGETPRFRDGVPRRGVLLGHTGAKVAMGKSRLPPRVTVK